MLSVFLFNTNLNSQNIVANIFETELKQIGSIQFDSI